MVHHNHSRRPDDDRVEVRTVRDESESVTHMILRGLSVKKNVPIRELEPLYEQVETEALDSLLTHAEGTESTVSVEFATDDHTVVVTHRDCVCVRNGDHLAPT